MNGFSTWRLLTHDKMTPEIDSVKNIDCISGLNVIDILFVQTMVGVYRIISDDSWDYAAQFVWN